MQIISAYSSLPLVSTIFAIVLGFFVWLKKPKEWLHILFFLYAFTIAIWLFGTFMLFNSINESEQVRWDRFIYAGVVFIPIFLYHFGLIYCNIKKQKPILVVGYLLAFFFLPISQTDFFVRGIYKYSWGVHTVAQTFHHFFLIYFFFYFILFFVNLGLHYKRAEGVRKKQVGYVLLGYGILDLIGPLAFLPAYGIPIYPVVFLSAIPFALILAYAIIRHNALDLKTITVEVVVTLLNLAAIADVIFAKTIVEFLFRAIIILVVFIFSIVLVRSVKKEIRRREEITKLADSLETANAQLKELDQQKTEFLSIASHQLRTPLSILKGYIELIKDGAYGKIGTKTVRVLDEMDVNNEHLVKLVDEFLDITHIEQGRIKYNFKSENICEITDNAIHELLDRASQKGLDIRWACPRDKKNVYCDKEKVYNVVFNFIDNAIKYTENGIIKITLENEMNGVAFKVQDQGIGFDKSDEASFYQKFYRGNNVKGMNVNGTGLGLYVCRKFIEAHGGKVWAHSNGIGQGSEFGFWIPFSKKA